MSYHGEKVSSSLTPQVYQGTAYTAATADTVANVADVILLSTGERIAQGYVVWNSHGLTVGAYYFLSQTVAGGYTATVPTSGLYQRLFFVVDANTLLIDVQPATRSSAAVTQEIGDLKQSLKNIDHVGWIKLDGRVVSSLTATQQTAAASLGYTTTLPNATFAYIAQTGTPGVLSGANTRTLTQANLPNINLTSNGGGGHEHPIALSTSGGWPGATDPSALKARQSPVNEADVSTTDRPTARYATTGLIGAVGAHTHTVPLGGSAQAIDITPRTLGANTFVYLGL